MAPQEGDYVSTTTTSKENDVHQKEEIWPEERFEGALYRLFDLRNWTYSYMNPLLSKGSKQKQAAGKELTQDDLYPVPDSIKSSLLVEQFNIVYSKRKEDKQRLFLTLWDLSKSTFIPAGFCQFITVICQVAMPLFVRQLLRELEKHQGERVVQEALPYAVGIFLSLFFNAVANHRHRHLATKTGIILRSAIVGVIYDRVLRLTPAGRAGVTSGEVNTLVAIDTHKMFEVTQEAHLTWSMPLSMTLVTIFLLLITGPTAFVGLAVLMMFVPVVERVASKMLAVRHERVKKTDVRVEIVSSMLQGMKVTKLNNYEQNYKQRIDKVRREEHLLLQRELAWWAVSLVITVVSPMLASASAFTTYVLVDEGNLLTASRTFTVLLLFQALRFPIAYSGRLIGRAAQAIESARRIDKFLHREIRSDGKEQPTTSQDTGNDSNAPVLSVTNGTFTISRSEDGGEEGHKEDNSEDNDSDGDSKPQEGPSEKKGIPSFFVSGLNFSVRRGEILAVVGPVGSGKSTVINGLIREVQLSAETNVSMTGNVTYVSQTALVLNATVRDNVLFGLPFEEDWYNEVIQACCLLPDLKQLGGAGDLTEIGERGVTLSGGQKQRISIARAVYARPDLLLMDDPISALDAGTARKIFDTLIQSKTSLMKNTGIVLVTHASHFLNRVDRILVIVEGQGRFCGTWSELTAFKADDQKTKDAVEFIVSSVQEVSGDDDEPSGAKAGAHDSSNTAGDGNGGDDDGRLMTVEERKHGLSSLRTWTLWFRYAGGLPFVLVQVVLMTLDRSIYVASEYWLARWTDGAYDAVTVFGFEFASQSEGRSAQFQYLKVFASIIAAGSFFTLCRSEWAVTGGTRCSKTVFTTMLDRVLLAPVSYFESTPLGRILNRFTYDTEVIDLTLTEAMSILMIAIGWFCAGVVVMVTILPYIAFALVPAICIYWLLLLHYRKSGTDLQRIDAVARSPIQAFISEGLEGATTIRVFSQVPTFVSKFFEATDKSSSALLNFVSAQRWLGLRIEVLGGLVVLIAATLICFNNNMEPSIVALLIIWSGNFTITLGFLVDYLAEGEAAITSIERVDAMVTIPQEKDMQTESSKELPPAWPQRGKLEFEQVCFRYRDGLPLALDSLSFVIPPGKRVGVVGRTGAGKSSLTVALFRLQEVAAGRILLDDVDLAQIGLKDVRGRVGGMNIIPQDPFIAGTTLRECVDPFASAADEDVLDALVSVRLLEAGSPISKLATPVAEAGSNYSVGERQLLNLARALLAKPKVLLLDEATASIDGETDALIQKMLRERFEGTTLLTIAHRLNTIMDYDLILVMDKGRAVEFGNPYELLAQQGLFFDLVNATGNESAKALNEIARLSITQ